MKRKKPFQTILFDTCSVVCLYFVKKLQKKVMQALFVRQLDEMTLLLMGVYLLFSFFCTLIKIKNSIFRNRTHKTVTVFFYLDFFWVAATSNLVSAWLRRCIGCAPYSFLVRSILSLTFSSFALLPASKRKREQTDTYKK